MWSFQQSTGVVSHNGLEICDGYAGNGEGKNNADMDAVANVGPLPKGRYIICAPVDTKTHGPYVLRLNPDPSNEMHQRAGFLIHGDSVRDPGTASQGCIILGRKWREKIWMSGDHELIVFA